MDLDVSVVSYDDVVLAIVSFVNNQDAYFKMVDSIVSCIDLTEVAEEKFDDFILEGKAEKVNGVSRTYKDEKRQIRFRLFKNGRFRIDFNGGVTLYGSVPINQIEVLRRVTKQVKVSICNIVEDTTQAGHLPQHEYFNIEGIR